MKNKQFIYTENDAEKMFFTSDTHFCHEKVDIAKVMLMCLIHDVVEIDAASNNSVEDIRDLREGTVYRPERCAYKIYIIDEVHMLSPSAWGALLKVMEEPPAYVKFILATTEMHKVPATILSRCQRFAFHRIRLEDIAARLRDIAEKSLSRLQKEMHRHR